MPQSRRVLVVAAHPDETKHLPPDAEILITGVGMVAASARLMAEIQERDAKTMRDRWAILNLGSAGSVRPGLAGLVEPGRIVNRDVDERAASAVGLPASVITLGDAGPTLGTGDSFVMDPETSARLRQRCDLVDMEGYSLAWVAELMGIPFRTVKHISDDADEEAAAWDENVQDSATALAGWYAVHCADHRLLV